MAFLVSILFTRQFMLEELSTCVILMSIPYLEDLFGHSGGLSQTGFVSGFYTDARQHEFHIVKNGIFPASS